MKIAVELAVLWLGPQDETGKLPLDVNEESLWRHLFDDPMPLSSKRMSRRCLLHIRIFLQILHGRMP